MGKKETTKSIINFLIDEKFNRPKNWSTKDCIEYIKANFICSNYVAKNAGMYLHCMNIFCYSQY